MKFISFVLIGLSIALLSCSSSSYIRTQNPEISLTERIDSVNIVVLPFAKNGSLILSNSGILFANSLAEKLFSTNNFFIVDRSKIKEVLNELDIKNPIGLSSSELQNIGNRLEAKFIITGNINQYSDKELISIESELKVKITFRIISTENGDIVGVVDAHGSSRNRNITDVLDEIANTIVMELNNVH